MIHILSGLSAVISFVNSRNVVFESSNDLEGHSNGTSIVESVRKLSLISLRDIETSMSHISHRDRFSVDACSVLGSVGISDIRFNSASVSDVFEGVRRKTSLATVVVKVTSTVNELLLREGEVFALAQYVPVGL